MAHVIYKIVEIFYICTMAFIIVVKFLIDMMP